MSLLPLYLLGLLLSSGQALLQVTISLSKVELSVGESKFFTCTAIGEPDNIDWYNPQGEKIVSSQRVVVQKEGVRSRLTIYNADIEDAGIYRCQATDAKGQSQEATVVLEIYQKLTFRDIISPQEFRQGEDAEVVCRVTSSPAPVVSWLYRNEEVTTTADSRFAVLANNNLQILNINKSDEGVYRCEGRVEARGEIDFRDIIVIVNGIKRSSYIKLDVLNLAQNYFWSNTKNQKEKLQCTLVKKETYERTGIRKEKKKGRKKRNNT